MPLCIVRSGSCTLSATPWRWRQHLPPKYQWPFTNQNGVTSQKTWIFFRHLWENLESHTYYVKSCLWLFVCVFVHACVLSLCYASELSQLDLIFRSKYASGVMKWVGGWGSIARKLWLFRYFICGLGQTLSYSIQLSHVCYELLTVELRVIFIMLFSIVHVSATKTNAFVGRNRTFHSIEHRGRAYESHNSVFSRGT
jgi:hypothetical protein